MFAGLQRHRTYRTAESPWLVEIPSQWKLERFKSLLSERVTKGFPNEPLLAATQSKGVVLKSTYESRTVIATKDLHLLKLVEVGDFVISLRSFQGGIERCHHRGIISPAYTVLHTPDAPYRDYLAFLFKSTPFVESLTLAVTGIREGQNIDYARLATEMLPVPPAEEQAAIVKYLAHATARIDKAIATKRRLIALLDEQRASAIRRVLKQVQGSATPLKFTLQDIKAGAWGQSTTESSLPARWCVRVADFDYSANAVKSEPRTLRAVSLAEFEKRKLRKGDLLLEGSGGGDKTPVGRVVVFNHEEPALCSNFLQRLRVKKGIDPAYLAAVLRDFHATGAIRLLIKQTTGIQNLDLNAYLSTRICIPDWRTQSEVLATIRSSVDRIDSLADRATTEVGLLREFRTRLIADVVTGQVDVRAVAATLPDVDPAIAWGSTEPADESDDAELDEALDAIEED